jgi:D-arabinose 1-dehydrogenase-like Zn-dependent alcohol dehydrogenase
MKALAMRQVGIAELVDLPEPPAPASGEVAVDVDMVSLGVSELQGMKGNLLALWGETIDPDDPFVFGFAGVGHVTDPGDSGMAPGQRALLSGVVTCGECAQCRAGRDNLCPQLRMAGIHPTPAGYCRERAVLPSNLVFPVPDELSDEQACLAGEVASSLHLLRLGGVTDGTTLAVIGAGRHGRHAIRLGKLLGAVRVVAIDPDPAMHELALAAGADEAVASVGAVRELVTVVAHTAPGIESLVEALDICAPGGCITGLGTPVTPNMSIEQFYARVVKPERVIVGSRSKTKAEFRDALALMAQAPELWQIPQVRHVPFADGAEFLSGIVAAWPLAGECYLKVTP